jgi:hypothetical protein
MGRLSRGVSRLILFDGRGASPSSRNFFAQFGFDAVFNQPGPLRVYLRAHLNSPFRILYQPIVLPPALDQPAPGLAEHFAAVTQLVIACGRMIYAVDEIDRFTTAQYMPAGLDYLVNQGRHVQVSLMCTSRRPAQIPRELTSQAHRFFVFRMTEPADLDYLQKYIGAAATETVRNLADYACLEWEESTGPRLST